MKRQYASVVVGIGAKALDREFQYAVPDSLQGQIRVGSSVSIPFRNRVIDGYVTELSHTPQIPVSQIKEILGLKEINLSVEAQLVRLAGWMREHYGCTMLQALKTVMPVKENVKPLMEKKIISLLSEEELDHQIELIGAKKNQRARLRLLTALREDRELPYSIALNRLNLTSSTLKPLIEAGWVSIEEMRVSRTPLELMKRHTYCVSLNEEQTTAVKTFADAFTSGVQQTYLLHGVTGSGKTEVYMEMIEAVLKQGKQVIVLIPEIALTYQTVMRFYRRFGDTIALVNSKLSKGERYDQFCRAENGEASIMIGPRSALFTPFRNLGLIIIDECHEHSYKSENIPRYHAKDVAAVRCELAGASLVLGSATPSVSDYYRAKTGEYQLLSLTGRAAAGSSLPCVEIVDLRQELLAGNKQIFSRRLRELMDDRLEKGEQIMLFLNRRGYSGFISCRSCGKAIKCQHCDVSMTVHRNHRMVCHYCGNSHPVPKVCPSCSSPYIAGFGTGTEKVEQQVSKMFPQARVLRMDMDTTSKKGSHEQILSAFAAHEADILIGTQMIVKGHDFPNVTLVGILAADLSLFAQDYQAGAGTFSLLTQASGRAGRGNIPGNVVIQTYNPDNSSICHAATQDYLRFYEEELPYRKLLKYPPFFHMLTIQYMSEDESLIGQQLEALAGLAVRIADENRWRMDILGPADGSISKIKDVYRKVLYIKALDVNHLEQMRKELEASVRTDKRIQISYDWNED